MSTAFPRMFLLRQKFPPAPGVDAARSVREEMAAVQPALKPGMRVAVAVGSRGITNLQAIVSAVVETLQSAGAEPFIIPAMGSHGGATPEGQTELLAEYGITEHDLHVPIRATMEVERIGVTPEGVDVYCSVEAMRGDAIVIVNRIKPHTDFSGRIGSGIMKMMVIGLGKRVGAANYHVAAGRLGYEETLRAIARVTLRTAPILCGIAILENQRHETARIALLPREEVEAREEELFQEAKRLMPKLPFEDIDLLIVDRLGKNISGSGIDPNIIGRGVHGYSSFLGQKNLPPPRIKRIFVRDLTPETHGNAIGIGFADLTTTRLVEGMDRRVTYVNALTSLTPNGAKIPIHFDTDQEALALGLQSLGLADGSQARVVRIQDTLTLEDMEISEAYLPALTDRTDLEARSELKEMRFDSAANLVPLGK
jgi:Lactate racemase N-terminal domain